MNIDDVEECRATSEALHNQLIELGISQHDDPTQIFANEEVSENYPKGCYLTGSSTYWNNHNTGSRQTGSRSICKKGRTKTELYTLKIKKVILLAIRGNIILSMYQLCYVSRFNMDNNFTFVNDETRYNR